MESEGCRLRYRPAMWGEKPLDMPPSTSGDSNTLSDKTLVTGKEYKPEV